MIYTQKKRRIERDKGKEEREITNKRELIHQRPFAISVICPLACDNNERRHQPHLEKWALRYLARAEEGEKLQVIGGETYYQGMR